MSELEKLAWRLGVKLIAQHLTGEKDAQQAATDMQSNDALRDKALLTLKQKAGCVVVIIGRRESGKTILSARLAEFFARPTYIITPSAKPLNWMIAIKPQELDTVPPRSTVILDDVPVYMSSRDYQNHTVKNIEKIIPVVRHKGLVLIFISQTSGFADRWVMDADAVFVKQPSLLYADTERSAVKKIMDRAMPSFENKDDYWVRRHAYMVTDIWEGVLEVGMPGDGPGVYEAEFSEKIP